MMPGAEEITIDITKFSKAELQTMQNALIEPSRISFIPSGTFEDQLNYIDGQRKKLNAIESDVLERIALRNKLRALLPAEHPFG